MKAMTSKFNGTCRDCGARIDRGAKKEAAPKPKLKEQIQNTRP